MEQLGGADTHAATSRRRALRARLASPRASQAIRELFRFIPSNNLDEPPRGARHRSARPPRRSAARHRARQPEQAVRHARRASGASSTTASSSRCSAISPRTSSCGFAHLGGYSVGIVANQPAVLAGVLDISASRQGRALHPLLRRVQHSARDVRGRARASCPASRRSTAASSSTAPSCCTRTARRPCPSSPSSRARRTAARTTS